MMHSDVQALLDKKNNLCPQIQDKMYLIHRNRNLNSIHNYYFNLSLLALLLQTLFISHGGIIILLLLLLQQRHAPAGGAGYY